MKTNKNKKPTIPLETFAGAFMQVFNCNRTDIEIEMVEDNYQASVTYKGQLYKIKTWLYLLEGVQNMLTDKDQAQLINLDIWLEVSQGVLFNPDFLLNLIESIGDIDEAKPLQLAITLSSFVKNDDELFWNTLYRFDTIGTLFGSAIVAAAKLYDINILADDILDAQILNGEMIYNETVGGIFKEVILPQDDKDGIYFYIHSSAS